MKLNAVFLNCTLKKSPALSNTDALIQKVVKEYKKLDVTSEVIRVVDYNIPFGISSDEGPGDEWPKILKQLKAADIILIASPIWFGVRASVTQLVIERLDGTYEEGDNKTGQFPLYNKVAGCIVTGNEDGAHDVAANTLFNLTHLGCVIPPNVDTYWVGPAGPGPSYIEADGQHHLYTNKTLRFLAHNTAYMAKLLKEHPIPTNLKELIADAQKESHDPTDIKKKKLLHG
ncbi:MAG: flavodoxin family protein [Candidatus Levyibacteriota bacterium]